MVSGYPEPWEFEKYPGGGHTKRKWWENRKWKQEIQLRDMKKKSGSIDG